MKPNRPRIPKARARKAHGDEAHIFSAHTDNVPLPRLRAPRSRTGSPRGPVPQVHAARIRRPRRGTALLAVAALGLTAPATATTTATPGTAGAPQASAARPDAPCSPAPVKDVQMSEGIPTPAGHAPSTGTLRALNLMIDFPDARGQGTAEERYAEFFPETSDWYATSSYGAVSYRADAPVDEWLRMPRPFNEYGIDRGVGYEPGYRLLVEDIVAAADERVDFAAYDIINVLVTPNAGPSALDTVLSVTYAGLHDAPEADGVPLAYMSFVYSRQDDGSPSAIENAYRVLPHENAHTLGLPDLYTSRGGERAGHWDIMSEDWGANNDLLGWHKRKLGWLAPDQVACAKGSGSSEHSLIPLARRSGDRGGGVKLVYVPVSERTGYAVEFRTEEGNDAAVCRPGVLVYWVDTGISSGEGPITVRDSRPDSNGCAHLPNVNAELTDAAYTAGERMSDSRTGITIEVLDKDAAGNYRVKVTRP
ncbi:M6 family metalloprotease domain-containing protein [Streptomyces sp. KR80]|uniref:M6 family metalloprotease domain-containing protein n=1 Tax=Streptomyces sp. KR80 TaxID=3457426 RepID=UPI003FCF4678